MKKFLLISCIIVSCFMYSCNKKTVSSTMDNITKNIDINDEVTLKSNNFAFEFFKEVNKLEKDKKKDIFVSPLSASLAFSMAAAGASGETQKEMFGALGYEGLNTEQVNELSYKMVKELLSGDKTTKITIANSVWGMHGFVAKKDFLNTLKKYYMAEYKELAGDDKKAVDEINRWCEEKTNGLIKQMVNDVSELKLMLANALYFKGMWEDEFNKKQNYKDKFYNYDGSTKEVDFMYRSFDGSIWNDEQFALIDLPYKNLKFAMTILLPKQNVDIDNFINSIDAENFDKWICCNGGYKIRLSLPKFESEYEMGDNLILAMRNMGMNLAFTPAADFSKMGNMPIFIDEAKQKAVIKVNEEGTEAAAVTTIGMKLTSVGAQKPVFEFKVNRPFVYLIRDLENGVILFVGKKNKF